MRFFWTIASICVLCVSLGTATQAQHRKASSRSKSKGHVAVKKAPQKTAKPAIDQEEPEEEILIDKPFVLGEPSEDCSEQISLARMPKPYKRVNLNDLEGGCTEKMMTADGLSIDPVYLAKEEYFKIWNTDLVNPYRVPFGPADEDAPTLSLFDESNDENWSMPLDNIRVTSRYGFRWKRFHYGIDFGLHVGDTVRSVFDGVVRVARYHSGGYGKFVVVRHKNGLETVYAHLSHYDVKPGDELKAGEMVGLGGNTGRSTGPHLHFEVRYKGYAFNPQSVFDFEEENVLQEIDEAIVRRNTYNAGKFSTNSFKQMSARANTATRGGSSGSIAYHRIRPGDNLWKIAQRYRTTVAHLCKINGLSKNAVLPLGKNIKVK